MPEIAEHGCEPSDSTRRWRRVALLVSLVVHVALLTALGVWFVGRRNAERSAAQQTNAKSLPQPKLPSPEVSSKQIRTTLERATEQFAEKSTGEQLNELEKQAVKLESLSSQQSVGEIAEKFQEWIPTPERASEPAAETLAGEFDFDTAQIHDVVRTAAADGAWEYRSVLIDASGRTFEVQLESIEGEKVFATFESLKKFPLANQVYRQIAMGLMDRALQADRRPKATPTLPLPAVDESHGVVLDERDPFDDSGSTR